MGVGVGVGVGVRVRVTVRVRVRVRVRVAHLVFSRPRCSKWYFMSVASTIETW